MNLYIPEKNPHYVCPNPEAWSRLDRLHKTTNVLLTGPSGSGKTTYGQQFAAHYSRPAFTLECGAVSEAEQIIGQWEVVTAPSGGSITKFSLSPFLQAVQVKNSVIILNELNRLQSIKSENALMSLLDYQRRLDVQELDRTIHVGENVIFFATINEGSQYTATDLLDQAMRSRHSRAYEIGWLDEKTEYKILMSMARDTAANNRNMAELSEDHGKAIIRLANALRGTAPISLRQMEACAEELMLGAPIEEAVTITFGSIVDMEEIGPMAAAAIPGFNLPKKAKK